MLMSNRNIEESILLKLREAAEKHDNAEPQWLKEGIEPDFDIVEFNGNEKGPIILLLHGLFGALSNWDGIIQGLQTFSRPIAVKFPIITGRKTDTRVKALALLTEFIIRKKGFNDVILCGNSLGGHVALRLCLASQDLIKALILTGTSGLYEHTVDSLPVRPDKKFVIEHMRRVFFNKQFITDEAVDEITAILKSKSNVLNLINVARSAKKDNLRKRLKDINVPTLLLWGEDDHITTMEVARTFHRYILNSKLVSIKECGHAPMIEHSVWFAEEVQHFIDSIGYRNF
jgi:pimeloyl-ACP methyl ester carboxylesterase